MLCLRLACYTKEDWVCQKPNKTLLVVDQVGSASSQQCQAPEFKEE